MGITSSATEVGAGLQSAIVLGIFRTYEELKKSGAVFAIEEPEVFLHPQKARYFASILKRLTEGGNQVFVTTHSPIFVPIDTPEAVFIARRTASTGTKVFQSSQMDMNLSDRQALRLMSEFDAQRNELFFARKIILVEGNTEKVALPLLFRKLNTDINRAGISVIECGGKTKLPLFAKVANAFSIPFVILADEDLEPGMKADDRSQHERWNQQLRQCCPTDRLFFMKPTFEAETGLPNDDSEKLDQALKFCQEVQPGKIPTILKQAIETLVSI
jgi:predicted ATP-dependent endonuclease of OLD family